MHKYRLHLDVYIYINTIYILIDKSIVLSIDLSIFIEYDSSIWYVYIRIYIYIYILHAVVQDKMYIQMCIAIKFMHLCICKL